MLCHVAAARLYLEHVGGLANAYDHAAKAKRLLSLVKAAGEAAHLVSEVTEKTFVVYGYVELERNRMAEAEAALAVVHKSVEGRSRPDLHVDWLFSILMGRLMEKKGQSTEALYHSLKALEALKDVSKIEVSDEHQDLFGLDPFQTEFLGLPIMRIHSLTQVGRLSAACGKECQHYFAQASDLCSEVFRFL